MSINKPLFSLAFAAVMAFPVIGHADIFVWQNQEEDVSLTFPDSWAIVSNLEHDEVLRIKAPAVTGKFEDAECRLRVEEDGRFKMHPVSHSGALQREHFGIEFWDDYVAEYKHAGIHLVKNNVGIGRGFASMADITYEGFGEPKAIRRAVVFASHYDNRLHLFECSSEQAAFEKWYPSFMGILKSVDFKPMVPFERGYYRDFYGGETVIHGKREIDDYSF